MTTTRLTAVLIVTIMLAIMVMLSGCATLFQPSSDLSAAQLKEISKDKTGMVLCTTVIGPWGTAKNVLVQLDQNVIREGGVSVDANCLVNMQLAVPPRVAPTPPVAAPLKPPA